MMTRRLAPIACVVFLAVLSNGCGYHHIGTPPTMAKQPKPAATPSGHR